MLRLAVLLGVLVAALAAHADPAIDWRLKQPFRYFVEPADFAMQREAMADVLGAAGTPGQNPVSDLERVLNDPRWLMEWYRSDSRLYPDPTRTGRPERGWAHAIDHRRATCWDNRQQWHSSCASDSWGAAKRTDYVLPQGHTVLFTVKGAPSGICTWQAPRPIFKKGGASLAGSAQSACGADVAAYIPFEPQLPEAQQAIAVSVTLPDGSMLTEPAVRVRDRLVVGIGDSYSSGEGNPDTPAEIDPLSRRVNLNMAFVYDEGRQAIRAVKSNSLPVRAKSGPSGWIDRKCHRSAYSYHLRTALQVALADPRHSAVTFLGYACSGAEITEGFLFPYEGVESVDPGTLTADGKIRRDMPELDRLTLELCRDDLTRHPRWRTVRLDQPITYPANRKNSSLRLLDCPAGHFLRPIDMLIVSVGGNDVGFTPLIVDVLTKTQPPYADTNSSVRAKTLGAGMIRFMARLLKADCVDITHRTFTCVGVAQRKALELPARFAALRKALAPLPIAAYGGRPNILLTAFPKIEFNEAGKLCGATDPRERLEGFNIGGMLSIDVPELRLVSGFANGVLYPALKQAAAAGNWHFVERQREAFATHGVCAQKRGAGGVTAIENMMLPYTYQLDNPPWHDFDPFSAHREGGPNAARDTRPYAPRQRWLRTLNDICLFVQFKQKGAPPPNQKLGPLNLLESCMGGPFHPTAEGHAHIADAVYEVAAPLLGLPLPSVAALRGG